jgi:ribonuclease J
LARSGALSIGLALDSKGRLASRPSVQARGVVAADDEASTLRFVALEVAKALEGAPAARDDDAIAEIARLAARRAIETRTGRKPVCLVTLVRV